MSCLQQGWRLDCALSAAIQLPVLVASYSVVLELGELLASVSFFRAR